MLGEIAVTPVMAFTGGVMRVALVTTHIPLSAVHDAITPARIGTPADSARGSGE